MTKKDLGPKPKARRIDPPVVAEFGDHQVITLSNPLGLLVRRTDDGAPTDDPVARAERALQSLSGQFDGWMREELELLERTREHISGEGLSQKSCDALFRAAHDIRGDGATFGYASAARAADSLCRVIEHAPDVARLPLELVDYHIDAIRAIVREHGKIGASEVAEALCQRLRAVADEYLIDVNRDRPEHLDAVRAPSIAPTR